MGEWESVEDTGVAKEETTLPADDLFKETDNILQLLAQIDGVIDTMQKWLPMKSSFVCI